MRIRGIVVPVAMMMLSMVACAPPPQKLSLYQDANIRCPTWVQYSPTSTCDIGTIAQDVSTNSFKFDMSEYEAVRMRVSVYDIFVEEAQNVRIESDFGEVVDIRASRLLPGVYIIYNEVYEKDLPEAEERQMAFLELVKTKTGNDTAYVQFEFIRPAWPTLTPTPAPTPTPRPTATPTPPAD